MKKIMVELEAQLLGHAAEVDKAHFELQEVQSQLEKTRADLKVALAERDDYRAELAKLKGAHSALQAKFDHLKKTSKKALFG